MYEHRRQPVLSTAKFLRRVARHWLVGFGVLAFGLGGSILIAGLSWIDLLPNASMIPNGMGPVDPLKATLRMKKFLLSVLLAAAVLAGMAGCAQIKRPAAEVRAVAVGLRFDQVGWVSLYAGEPCTPQIMFDFHGTRSTVWLAAPRRETDVLTDAANKNHHVHISGRWRRAGQANCSYVQVTSAELSR